MLKNYIVMITGATSGIGLATTKEFLDQGATVIGIGRNFSRTKDLGENFLPFKCDVTDEEQIKAAVAFAKEKFGRMDSLICNAGSAIVGTVEESLSGLFNYMCCTRRCLPSIVCRFCVNRKIPASRTRHRWRLL